MTSHNIADPIVGVNGTVTGDGANATVGGVSTTTRAPTIHKARSNGGAAYQHGIPDEYGADAAVYNCAVVTYDYLVIAGTQGTRGHMKKDRLFELYGARVST
jgi:hypothetical protein